MRSQTKTVADLLRYEAKKRPILQDLLDRISVITDDEINACPGLPWVRKELKRQRAFLEKQAESEAVRDRALTMIDQHVVNGVIPDPTGEIRRWTGQDTFLPLDRGSMLIHPGKLLFLPDSGGFWFQTVFAHNLTAEVFSQTVSLGKSTKSAYATQFQQEINGNHVDDNLPTLGDAPSPDTPGAGLGQYGVRFSR